LLKRNKEELNMKDIMKLKPVKRGKKGKKGGMGAIKIKIKL
jgi:hypothetical protein